MQTLSFLTLLLDILLLLFFTPLSVSFPLPKADPLTSSRSEKYFTIYRTAKFDMCEFKQKVVSFPSEYIKLIRAGNILPTIFLSTAGGKITNPRLSFGDLLFPRILPVTTLIILLIMSSSMILNDFFDFHIDFTNAKDRPLVKGTVSRPFALILFVGHALTCEWLNTTYLPEQFRWITHLALVLTSLYTPVVKKILLLKNIFCASLISFSVFFSAVVVSKGPLSLNPNFDLLVNLMNTIFFVTLNSEIMMDIRDIQGDTEWNIQTIPSVFGKDLSLKFCSFCLLLAMIINKKIWSLPLLLISQMFLLYEVQRNDFSETYYDRYFRGITLSLFVVLLECILFRIEH